jgi:uncharacterized protein
VTKTAADLPAVAPARTPRRLVNPALAACLVLGLVGAGFALRLLHADRVPWLATLLLLFSSLLIQAFPFVLLGALASAAIEVFVPGTVFTRFGRLPRRLQLPVAGVSGLAFPVCECGSVPVARRLATRGVSSGAAVTFMLAAPIVNPIVIVSTAVAYRGRTTALLMVLGRVGLGLAAAIAAGWAVGIRSVRDLLKPLHDEDDGHGSHGRSASAFFGHFAADAVFMGGYLVVGAAAAATLQTFVPASVMSTVAGTYGVDVLAMMALAGVLSLCSESDAFVAASFVQFGPAPQLAFLVFGPLVNLKLASLYVGTFRRGFVTAILFVAAGVTLAGTLWIEALVR